VNINETPWLLTQIPMLQELPQGIKGLQISTRLHIIIMLSLFVSWNSTFWGYMSLVLVYRGWQLWYCRVCKYANMQ